MTGVDTSPHSSSDASKISNSEESSVAVAVSGSGSASAFEKPTVPNDVYSFKILLLILMVLQNSACVLVGRYSRSSVAKEDLYSVNHLIIVIELSKLFMSALLELKATRCNLLESIILQNFQRPMDALKIMVPALLYLVQNSLLYVALSNLTAPLFQVTYQCKLITTAFASVVMLQRSYSVQQWTCLVGLSLGVAIVVLDKDNGNSNSAVKTDQNILVGLIAVTISCLSSAFAGVYFEKVLKKTEKEIAIPASLWMRNMQLAFFSVLIAIGQNSFNGSKKDSTKPYFHGFTFWVWVLVALQAGGGLLVAAVIKYADNVLKGLATGVSIVVATSLSTILFKTDLTSQFSCGAFLILVSVYFFSNPISSTIKLKLKRDIELAGLLPK